MKYLFSLMMMTSVLAGYSGQAKAAEPPFICVVSTNLTEYNADEPYFEEVKYTCEQLDRIGTGLEVASITVQGGAVISACTGAGAPVAVTLQGIVVGLRVIKLVVGNLPCEDMREKRIEAQVKQMVCEEMNRQGMRCQQPIRGPI